MYYIAEYHQYKKDNMSEAQQVFKNWLDIIYKDIIII